MEGRIYFPGNPWPEGHAIETLVWDGRVDLFSGLMFNLHLVSADYDAERSIDDDDDRSPSNDFEAPGVWGNFHHCILSSTYWHHAGWVVGNDDHPLDLAALGDRTFQVDVSTSPRYDLLDWEDRAFHVYLLGHDTVADHVIRFRPERVPGSWSLEWNGRIALSYAGDDELRYSFRVAASGLRFGGFAIDADDSDEAALAAVRRWCPGCGDLSVTSEETERGERRVISNGAW